MHLTKKATPSPERDYNFPPGKLPFWMGMKFIQVLLSEEVQKHAN
jgi:hypothetical protein